MTPLTESLTTGTKGRTMFSRRTVIRSDVEGRHDHNRERRHAERYARRHGYYWQSCILCGTPHGGHEAGGSLPAPSPTPDVDRITAICPWCTAERQQAAEAHLRELGRAATVQTSRWGQSGVVKHRVGERPEGALQDSFIVDDLYPPDTDNPSGL